MHLEVGNYVEGYEYFGTSIARVRGWIDSITVSENRVDIDIQCDDEYGGARGSGLIYGNINFPIKKLQDKERPGENHRANSYFYTPVYERFSNITIPFILKHDFRESVMCFDIDGVLAEYRFGNGVYVCKDSEFVEYCKTHDVYSEAHAPAKIKKFISDNLLLTTTYVISKAYTKEEELQKIGFVTKNYDISGDNIHFVKHDDDKLEVIKHIISVKNHGVNHKNIFMVDDSIGVLGHIQDNSDFGTIHISSLLNL